MKENLLFDNMFQLSNDKNIDIETNKLFEYYRQNGFPNYDKKDYSLARELQKLIDFDENKLFDSVTKEIGQSMSGLGILWTYFPHWIEVKCGGQSKSLIDLWNEDDKLLELIKKTYKWKLRHNEPNWTNNRIRQNAKVYLAKQSVSNFRPSVAKFIYNKYGNNGSVFDMSGGYGGRMLGFYASNCREYVACEPCHKTFNGLENLKNDCNQIINKNCTILNQGSEIYIDKYTNHFNLCFTSPPYFNTEKYSDEKSQSYLKYPTYDQWINGFLNQTIKNCYQYLRADGLLIINIANIKGYNLEEDTIRLAQNNNFILLEKLNMVLSSIAGNGKKYEPIFIFKKR